MSLLVSKEARVLYPLTAVAEANAYVQRVLNSTATVYGIAQFMAGPETEVIDINKHTLKKNTLFDCIVAVIAEEENADAIFSFDTFYKKHGFKLASEL